MEGTHEVGSRPFMPASTLSRRSVALLRVNLDDYTSEGRSISNGNYTRTLICWISEVVFDLEAQELVDMVILEL
jgi:hypothetical protein